MVGTNAKPCSASALAKYLSKAAALSAEPGWRPAAIVCQLSLGTSLPLSLPPSLPLPWPFPPLRGTHVQPQVGSHIQWPSVDDLPLPLGGRTSNSKARRCVADIVWERPSPLGLSNCWTLLCSAQISFGVAPRIGAPVLYFSRRSAGPASIGSLPKGAPAFGGAPRAAGADHCGAAPDHGHGGAVRHSMRPEVGTVCLRRKRARAVRVVALSD